MAFDSDGGSSVPRQRIEKGGKATEPADPTKEHNAFKGWQLNGEDFDFDTPITANIVLVATWNPTYTITVANSAGASATLTYKKVGDESDTTETIADAGSFVLPVEVEEGDAINTVYSKLQATYGDSGTWSADLTTTISSNTTLTIS